MRRWRAAFAVVGAVAEACPATALVFAMHLIHQRVVAHGVDWPVGLREQVGRDAVERGALINALRVEPGLGSPSRGGLPETVARQVPGGWALTGRKIYSTGAPGLSWFLVYARTDEAEPRVGLILVPADLPGITIFETWDHLGLRASGSHDVVFDQVFLADENLVDMRARAGWGRPDAEHAVWNTMLVSALYTGVATAAHGLAGRVPAGPGAVQPRRAIGHAAADAGGRRTDGGAAGDQPAADRECRGGLRRRAAAAGDRVQPDQDDRL